MSWFGLFGGAGGGGQAELPVIYPMSLACDAFVRADVRATYLKILTDATERTHGLKDEQWPLLWDSCVQSQGSEGLISMLADAMLAKSDLFLVYLPSVEVLRKATDSEARQIEADYKAQGKSKVGGGTGVFISFRNYRKTDMLKVFSEMEHCVLSSLYKTVNLAKAVQIKMSDMRSSVGLNDAAVTIAQAQSIAAALRAGKDVMIDAKDEVTTSTPDVEPTKQAIGFLDAKRAFHLSLPLAYISGLQTGGIGSTGDADARAIDRGLKQYFVSILQPVFEEVFAVDVEFRPEDDRQIEAGLEVLKAFDLATDTYLSATTKRVIAARAFDVDPEKEAELLEREAKERGTDTSLNGAQAAAMGAFLDQLAAGAIAPDSLIRSLMVSFKLSEDDAEAIVLPMQSFKRNTPAPAPVPDRFGA